MVSNKSIKIRKLSTSNKHNLSSNWKKIKRSRSLFGSVFRKTGRNNQGKIAVHRRGGGHKRQYRKIDFMFDKSVPAKIVTIEKDPNRSAFISQLVFEDGDKKYVIAGSDHQAGSSSINRSVELQSLALGTYIYNIEQTPGKGAQLVRSAGVKAKIVSHRDNKWVNILLPSKKEISLLGTCKAVVGQVSNESHSLLNKGKAGYNRWLGNRPRARKKLAKFRSFKLNRSTRRRK